MATMREHLKNFLEGGDKVVEVGSLSNGDSCLMLLTKSTLKRKVPSHATVYLKRDRGKIRIIIDGRPHEVDRRTPVIVQISP